MNKILNLAAKIKNNPVYLSALFVGLGLFLLIFPNLTLEIVFGILGILIVVKGVFDVIIFFKDKENQNKSFKLAIGVLEIIVGFNFVTISYLIASFASTIFGVFIIYNGARQIKDANQSKKYYDKNWLWMLILGIITIIFGVALILINPLPVVVRVMGLALIYLGFTNFIIAHQRQKDLDSLTDDE